MTRGLLVLIFVISSAAIGALSAPVAHAERLAIANGDEPFNLGRSRVGARILNRVATAADTVRAAEKRPERRWAQAGGSQAAGGRLPGETFRDCPECPEMIVVPAGDFSMGSAETPLERPIHHVNIPRPFAIGRREVSFAEWDQCVAAGACRHNPSDRGWGRGDNPVLDISWDDAQAYLSWLSEKTGRKYRLPTEAEWEYAARAGTTTPFWWGRDAKDGAANCVGCGPGSQRRTVPTASFRPNAFGLYDTSGNMAEWVEDCWNDDYGGAPKDGSAWTSGQCNLRVLRGGSFANNASLARSAARFRYDKDVRYFANGFRVVSDP
ncbi:MAG: formylglycine-generating enzyme family protein [Xanthobacteraceae bacterium]